MGSDINYLLVFSLIMVIILEWVVIFIQQSIYNKDKSMLLEKLMCKDFNQYSNYQLAEKQIEKKQVTAKELPGYII